MNSRFNSKVETSFLPLFGTVVLTGLVSMAGIWAAVAVAVVGFGGVALYLALDND